MIVDVHVHMGKGVTRIPMQHGITAEQVIRLMDEARIDKAVVFPVYHYAYDSANEEIKAAVDRYPDRLIGFGRINVASPEQAAREAAHAIKDLGLKGIGELALPWGASELECVRVYMEVIRECKVPVLFHAVEALERIRQIAREFKDVPVILGHMGGLWNLELNDKCIGMAKELDNVFLETSSVLFQCMIERAVKEVGPSKILFGSDAPALHPAVERLKIETLNISDSAKEMILGANAVALLSA